MSEASTAEAAPVKVERTKHKPDIGRIVLLHGLFPNSSSPDDTKPAIVTYVGVNGPAEPTCIEVEVFGGPYVALRGRRTAVVHLYDPLPDGAARPSPNGESLWAEWMPFQHAQHEAQAKIDETTKRWSELAAGERENSVIDAAVRELMGMVAANRPACNCIVCQARRDEGTKATDTPADKVGETPDEMAARMQRDHVQIYGREFVFLKFGEGFPADQREALERVAAVARVKQRITQEDHPDFFGRTPVPPGQVYAASPGPGHKAAAGGVSQMGEPTRGPSDFRNIPVPVRTPPSIDPASRTAGLAVTLTPPTPEQIQNLNKANAEWNQAVRDGNARHLGDETLTFAPKDPGPAPVYQPGEAAYMLGVSAGDFREFLKTWSGSATCDVSKWTAVEWSSAVQAYVVELNRRSARRWEADRRERLSSRGGREAEAIREFWETLTDKDRENWLTIARRMRSGKYAREEMSDFDLDDDDD